VSNGERKGKEWSRMIRYAIALPLKLLQKAVDLVNAVRNVSPTRLKMALFILVVILIFSYSIFCQVTGHEAMSPWRLARALILVALVGTGMVPLQSIVEKRFL